MRSQTTSPFPAIESKIRGALPRLYAWYRRNHRPLPWRTRPTPYRTAVAEFMCQQTRIATVIPYYLRWMRAFPAWSTLARATPSRVLRFWEGLGYYRRARFLHRLAKAVGRLPGRELPADPDELRRLPGIGDYTAGAIASIAFGKPAPAFDGNVARVLGRLASRRGRAPSLGSTRILAARLVPSRNSGLHNQALMELGALVCLPQNPRCSDCPLGQTCPSRHQLPFPARPRAAPLRQNETVWVHRRDRCVWLTKNHPAGRWQGLWLLPTQPGKPSAVPQISIRYAYTRHLVTASVLISRRAPGKESGRWLAPTELRRATLPAPHRKILRTLGIG